MNLNLALNTKFLTTPNRTGVDRRLGDLKYTLRPDIRYHAALEADFRENFQALNRITLPPNRLFANTSMA